MLSSRKRVSPWIGAGGLAVALMSTTVLTSPSAIGAGTSATGAPQVDPKIAALCQAQAEGQADVDKAFSQCIATFVGDPEVSSAVGGSAPPTSGGGHGNRGGSTSGGQRGVG